MFLRRRTYLDIAAGMNGPSPCRSWLRPCGGGNPSSPHEEGRRSREQLEGARTDIARLLEVQADDVIFTSGATEANAIAILGILKSGDHALYLPSAHVSIVENMKLAHERGVTIEALPIGDMKVDAEKLAKMLRPETKLVSMDAVCGETGVVWNTREVAEVLRNVKVRLTQQLCKSDFHTLLHVDASQAPLTEKMTRAHFDADLLVLDGAKVGPRGIGTLIAHRTIPIAPLYAGGGQERGVRPGSEAPELAKEFAAALCTAANRRENFRARAERARMSLIGLISPIRGILINEGRAQAPNILNLSFPGHDTDYLVALLDEAGFAVSTRSACETAKPLRMERSPGNSSDESLRDSEEGSRAVFALTNDPERARATLRISWGPDIKAAELVRFAQELARAVAFTCSE